MSAKFLSNAIERFLVWANRNRKPATVAVYERYLRLFLADKGDMDVTKITPALLENWSNRFHRVQAVQRLTAWLTYCERSLKRNPLAGMRKIPTGKRRRVLTRRESALMLRATDRAFRDFLLALRETIARPQEVRAFQWDDIRATGSDQADDADLAGGRAFFDLIAGKGFDWRTDDSRQRVIPIPPRLGRLLLRLVSSSADKTGPIFRNAKGRPWTKEAVRCRMRRLRERLNLGADRRGERVVAYSLRHTGATAAARAGVREWALAHLLGHAHVKTSARYVHFDAADAIDAAKRVWEAKKPVRPKIDRLGSLRTRPDDER